MKKFLTLSLALLMAASLFAGCGGAPSSTPAPASQPASAAGNEPAALEPTTIQVAFWDATTTERMDRLVKGFNKVHPEITVEIIDIPSADYNTKLSVMLNGGSEVDAYFIKDSSNTPSMVEKGQLADLSEYVKRDNIDLSMFSGAAENFMVDGKLMAMPASSSYYVLFYNKDLFDAAKLPYPTNDMTWTEFEELAAKLTSGSGAEKNYGAHFHTWQACIQNWAVADGSMTILSDDLSGFKPYYEMALRMQDAGYCMDYATLKTGNLSYNDVFAQGHVAMLPMGGWLCSTMMTRAANGETDVNWGIATLPHPEGVAAGTTVGSITPVAINSTSEKKDAAWEWVKFVTSEEGAKIHASVGEFPAYLSPETLADIATMPGMPEGALEALQVTKLSLDRPIDEKSADVNQMLGEVHSLIMLKEVSVDKGIAQMEEQSKEIRNS